MSNNVSTEQETDLKQYVVFAKVSFMVEAKNENDAADVGYDTLKSAIEYADVDSISAEEGD